MSGQLTLFEVPKTVSIKVINMWSPSTNCVLCGNETFLGWAIAWYEGPIPADQEDLYPEACGMPVCEECYQRHYHEPMKPTPNAVSTKECTCGLSTGNAGYPALIALCGPRPGPVDHRAILNKWLREQEERIEARETAWAGRYALPTADREE